MNKKIILLTIFILSLLTLSAVSASDNIADDFITTDEVDNAVSIDYDDASSDEVSVADNVDGESQSIEITDNDTLSDPLNTGSFDDLQNIINNAAEGSTITLESDYTYNDGFDTKGIKISKSLTIDGGGHILNGGKKARIFIVDGGSVTLKNIQFRCGRANSEYGGAVCGACTVIGCRFDDNCAGMGGCLYDVDAINSIFSNSQALIDEGGGGAMYKGTAVNCTFDTNDATFSFGGVGYGGAVKDCDVVNCTFKNNHANCGGAMIGGSAVNCTFIGNGAGSGGAIREGNAYGCYFINNSADTGGGLYMGYAFNCTFTGNTATWGGATSHSTRLLCILKNNNDYNTTVLAPSIIASQSISVSLPEKLSFSLNYDGQDYYGYNAKIEVYQDPSAVNTYYILTGNDWQIDLTPGAYTVKLSFDDFPEIAAFEISLSVHSETLILADDFISVYGCYDNHVIALKDMQDRPLSGAMVFVDLNGSANYTTDGMGQCYISTEGLNPGNYTVNAVFNGNEFSSASSASFKIIIDKCRTILSANPVIGYYNDSGDLIISLNDVFGNSLAGASVFVDLNGSKNYTTDDKGQIIIPTKGLVPDTYAVNISYYENDYYFASEILCDVVIRYTTKLTANPIISRYGDNDDLVITLTDNYGHILSGFTVFVDLNGGKNYTTDDDGQIKVSTSGLIPDTYTVNISFKGNEIYQKSNATTMIVIDKIITRLTVNAVTTGYNIPNDLIITLKDDEGNPLSGIDLSLNLDNGNNFTTDENGQIMFSTSLDEGWVITFNDGHGSPVNGIWAYVNLSSSNNYTTDENGQIKLSIMNLVPDTYIASIGFNGNELYYNSNATTKIIVNKEKCIITANTVSTYYKNNKQLVISLKDSHGNPIVGQSVYVALNGGKYYTTDKNGQIKISTKKLLPKNYVVKIKLAENNFYLKSQAKTVVVIKKVSSKLTAKLKSFKSKNKSKKYSVYLKTKLNTAIKKVKVYLVIKNKIYSAITNAKGKAIFKILNFSTKGKHYATVSYKGNSYSKEVAKKVKIIIK